MLEVFSDRWKSAIGHFIQGTVLLMLAIISWKWNILGGTLYVLSGLYILVHWKRIRVIFFIAGMLILTGLLFIIFNIL